MPESLPVPLGPLSAEELRRHVESYFADIPAEHVFAQVEYKAVDGTLRLETAMRCGEHWKVGGALAWNLKTGRVQEGSVRISGSWS